MHFFSTVVVFAAVPAAVFGATHTVTVGAGGLLMFNPPNITAKVGDTVSFQFMAKNHSVTQSNFATPCVRATFNNTSGVDSGFLSIPPNTTMSNSSVPTWSIMIQNTTPLWFYCAQKKPVVHCEKGMVFSINETPQKSFSKFLAMALASTNNSTGSANATSSGGASPSGVTPSDGAAPSGTASSDAASSSDTLSSSGGSSSDASSSATDSVAQAATSSAASTSGVAGAASSPSGSATSSSSSGTSAADHAAATTTHSGGSKTAFTRGAAGLLSVAAAAVGVVLL